jgi:uncharacterized protein YjbI with pentapeptide repeats
MNSTELLKRYADREREFPRIDLPAAYLSECCLQAVDLTQADLAHSNLSGSFLKDANLTGALLTKANLWRANLTGANLTGANFSESNLIKALLMGIRGDRVVMNKTDLRLAKCELNWGGFALCRFELCRFEQCESSAGRSDGCDCSWHKFSGCEPRSSQSRSYRSRSGIVDDHYNQINRS